MGVLTALPYSLTFYAAVMLAVIHLVIYVRYFELWYLWHLTACSFVDANVQIRG